jgi:hypothetical protein
MLDRNFLRTLSAMSVKSLDAQPVECRVTGRIKIAPRNGEGGRRRQQTDADEKMAAVWESLARMREKQLKDGSTQPVF